MKALSIKQPWASLIAHGIKDIENRNWRTHFRGKIYIHASAMPAGTTAKCLNDLQTNSLLNRGNFAFLDTALINSAIIGEVDIIDCVINHPSIWAEKTFMYEYDEQVGEKPIGKPIYNWVLANAKLYDKPILNVKGKLSLWEFDQIQECHICTNNKTNSELNECERCNNYYCEECSSTFNQFSQIDYNCCEKCSNTNHED
jgi:hypothetical protein